MNAGGVDKACKSYGPFGDSGKRVSNTWITNPKVRHSPEKSGVIPDGLRLWRSKATALWDGSAAYQLVGKVMAYQGDDG